jgi:hypothetical protein
VDYSATYSDKTKHFLTEITDLTAYANKNSAIRNTPETRSQAIDETIDSYTWIRRSEIIKMPV